MVRRHPVVAYLVLVYALSWGWWLPMIARGEVMRAGQAWPTHLPGLAAPAVAALVVTALVDGRSGLADLGARVVRWRVGWTWWLLVVGTAALALLGLLVPIVTGDPVPDLAAFGRYSGIGEVGIVGMIAIALVVNGLGEEAGWRGLAADRLLPELGLRRTALLVALAWGAWHLPLFWIVGSFRDFGPLGILGWVVGLAAGSVVLTFLYRGTGRSILLVAAWHVAYNLTSATEATSGVVAGITSAAVIAAAVWILRHEQAATSG